MQLIIKVLSYLALIVSLSWLFFEPSFEPLLTSIISLSTLISSYIFGNKNNEESVNQVQQVSSNSTGIQANGNVTIGDSDKGEKC